MKKKKIVSKHIRMSENIARWYEEKASELGVSQSNLMIMALSQYIDQQKTIDMMPTYSGLLEKLKDQKKG